jgi:integrase
MTGRARSGPESRGIAWKSGARMGKDEKRNELNGMERLGFLYSTERQLMEKISLNMDEMVERYIQFRNDWTETSRIRNRTHIRTFVTWLGDRVLTPTTIQEFYNFIPRQFAPITASKMAICISGFCAWLYKDGWLRMDPSLGAKRPKGVPTMVLTAYTKNEYIKLRDGLPNPYRELAIVLWHTGMSYVDAIELLWREVDLNAMMILRRRKKMIHKNAALQTIPIVIGSDLHNLLTDLREQSPDAAPDDRVFPMLIGRTRLSMLFGMKEAIKRTGVTWRGTHGFRRAMCSALANSNVPILFAKAMSGHESSDMLTHYATMDHSKLRKELEPTLREHFGL